MVLFYRLHDVYALLALEDVYLVAGKDEQGQDKQEAAQGAHFGRQHFHAFVDAHSERLRKLVIAE